MERDPTPQTEKFKKAARDLETDEDEKRWEERLRKVAKPKQPEPAKKVGDETPNPLPDDPSESGGDGDGDPGRTS